MKDMYREWKESKQDSLSGTDSDSDSDDSLPLEKTQSSVSEEYDLKCLECDDTVCHGDEQQAMKPKLMLLGSGVLKALDEESESE